MQLDERRSTKTRAKGKVANEGQEKAQDLPQQPSPVDDPPEPANEGDEGRQTSLLSLLSLTGPVRKRIPPNKNPLN